MQLSKFCPKENNGIINSYGRCLYSLTTEEYLTLHLDQTNNRYTTYYMVSQFHWQHVNSVSIKRWQITQSDLLKTSGV